MENELIEELVALMSIYTAPAELQIKIGGIMIEDEASLESVKSKFDGVDVKIAIIVAGEVVNIIFKLEPEYPVKGPHVEVISKNIDTEITSKIADDIMKYVETTVPEYCIFNAVEFCRSKMQDHLQETICKPVNLPAIAATTDVPVNLPTNDKPPPNLLPHDNSLEWSGMLCAIGHMRNEQMYLKILKRWSKDHDVMLTIVNCGLHNIYIQLIASNKRNIDSLMRQWRAQCVDVDSRGKSCKEHMLTIVNQTKHFSTNTIQRCVYYSVVSIHYDHSLYYVRAYIQCIVCTCMYVVCTYVVCTCIVLCVLVLCVVVLCVLVWFSCFLFFSVSTK